MKILKFIVALVLAVSLIASVFVGWFMGVAEAETIGDKIHQYNSDIIVNENGSINVVEKILYDFGDLPGHGIIRDLPFVYGSGEDQVAVIFSDFSVTDEKGNPYNFIDYRDGYSLSVQVGDSDKTLTGEHWYYLKYKAHAVIDNFLVHDELYWNVTGNYWEAEVENSVVTVTVPGGTKEGKKATCYSGEYGSENQDCTAEVVSDNSYRFTLGKPIYGGGFTIVAGFEKGMVKENASIGFNIFGSSVSVYSSDVYIDGNKVLGNFYDSIMVFSGEHLVEVKSYGYEDYSAKIIANGFKTKMIDIVLEKTFFWKFMGDIFPWILLGVGMLLVFLMWFFKGRDPKGRGVIMPLYEAPDKLSPGEVGVIYDEVAHLHDISASIINMAVKGYLKIEKVEKEKKWYQFRDQSEYFFLLQKDAADGTNLEEFEKKIFAGIFPKGGKSRVSLQSLGRRFYPVLPKVKELLYESMVDKKYFVTNPDDRRTNYMVWGIVLIFLTTAVGVGLTILLDSGFYSMLPIVAVFFLIVAKFMPKKTLFGVEVNEKVRGFQMFLKATETDRLKKMFSPTEYKNVFEKYLPYAMVLGVEKEWAKQFEDLYKGMPDWYVGANQTGMLIFMNDLNRWSKIGENQFVAGAPNSGWKSSGWGTGSGGSSSWGGGSGFSGGFSGGGFGGGGGGRW
ncbi:MAG: DUF2207 domain-containing protein [Candidatus Peregrinibacteria bacterium]|nr:DUF2207 domain-containing protein [Candidatus Peregrinibacteria bacterium]